MLNTFKNNPQNTVLKRGLFVLFLIQFLHSAQTFTPTAIATVRGGAYSDNNYSGSATMSVQRGKYDHETCQISWLKFDLETLQRPVKKAVLRLHVKSITAPDFQTAWFVRNNNWTQSTLTWNTQPTITSPHSGTMGFREKLPIEPCSSTIASKSGEWIEFDITPYVNGELKADKIITLNIMGTSINTTVYDAPLSGALAPQLIAGELPATAVEKFEHPRLLVKEKDKSFIQNKINKYALFGGLFRSTLNEISSHVDKHVDDPKYILSRMHMFWNRKYTTQIRTGIGYLEWGGASGKSPYPTIKASGSGDWTRDTPIISEIPPYSDEADNSIVVKRMIEGQKIIEMRPYADSGYSIGNAGRDLFRYAYYSAFIYWLTGEEKYGNFAADILWQFAIAFQFQNLSPDTDGSAYAIRCGGIFAAETIHDDHFYTLPLTYDFIYNFLIEQGKDTFIIEDLLRKMCESRHGGGNNNWSAWQDEHLMYTAPILESDDRYPDKRGSQYFIDRAISIDYQGNLCFNNYIPKLFNPITGLENESPGYAYGVYIFAQNITLYAAVSTGKDPLAQFPVLLKGLESLLKWTDPRGQLCNFGDNSVYPKPDLLENLMAIGEKTGNENYIKKAAEYMNTFFPEKRGRMKTFPESICLMRATVPTTPADSLSLDQAFYSSDHNHLILRNGERNKYMGMSTLFATGSDTYHFHYNGLSADFYGCGYPLVGDQGQFPYFLSYIDDIYLYYYKQFVAHNTVVIDGGGIVKRQRMDLQFTDPPLKIENFKDSGNQVNSFVSFAKSTAPYYDGKTTGTQERLISLVRTSPKSYYHLDVYRSKKTGAPANRHYYLLHVGGVPNAEKFYNQDSEVSFVNATPALGDISGDYSENNMGLKCFENQKTTSLNESLTGIYSIKNPTDGVDLSSKIWLSGNTNRTLYTADAPLNQALAYAGLTAGFQSVRSPVLVAVQEGDAWTAPFVSVIESAFDGRHSVDSAKRIDEIDPTTGNVGIEIKFHESATTKKNLIHTVFQPINSSAILSNKNDKFKGTYGVTSRQDDKLEFLYLGKGHTISSKEGYRLDSIDSNEVTANLEFISDTPFLSCEDSVMVTLVPDQNLKASDLSNNSIYLVLHQKLFELNTTVWNYNGNVTLRAVVPKNVVLGGLYNAPLSIQKKGVTGTIVSATISVVMNNLPVTSLDAGSGKELNLIVFGLSPSVEQISVTDPKGERINDLVFKETTSGSNEIEIQLSQDYEWTAGNYTFSFDNGISEIHSIVAVFKERSSYLFPNPVVSGGEINMYLHFPRDIAEATVKVSDLTGRIVVSSQKITNTSYHSLQALDDSNVPLTPGIYFILVEYLSAHSDNSQNETIKMVVNSK